MFGSSEHFTFTRCLALLCCAFLLVSCAGTNSQEFEDSWSEYKLTILHTNDHHGRFWPNRDGEYGLAARKTLIDQIRAEVAAEGGHSLLLSGGDINTGVPESDMHDAEPDFKGMSLAGYNAMAVGNHEFDNSLATIRKQESWSNFPFLSANIYNEQGERLFKPYEIFEFDGLRVAVIGLTTEKTEFIGNQEFVEGLTFTIPENETASLMPQLKSKADVIIAVTHMGHHDYDIGSDQSLAQAIEDLDLIVGGHSAEPVCVDEDNVLIEDYQRGAECNPDFVNGTWIVQAHEWGKYVGRADLLVKADSIELESYQLIPVNLIDPTSTDKQWVSDYIAPNRQMLNLLEPFQAAGNETLGQKISQATGHFDKDDISRLPNSSRLGRLITEAQRVATNADIALSNPAGIRDSMPPGEITLKTILQISPFNNQIVLNTFTGAELRSYFEAIGLLPANETNIAFSGIHFEDGQLLQSATGVPLIDEAHYLVALNDFIAKGGDGFPDLTSQPRYLETGLIDYQVLMDYIGKFEAISPQDY